MSHAGMRLKNAMTYGRATAAELGRSTLLSLPDHKIDH